MRRFLGCLLFLGSVLWLIAHDRVSGQSETPPTKNETPKYEWPKEIGGKTLAQWVRDMRENKDPSVREMAVRIIPSFGPDARKVASENLLWALTKDTDWAVRMSAMAVVPSVGFEDKETKAGIKAMIDLTRSNQYQTRFDAIVHLGNCGPIAGESISTIVSFGLQDLNSWQIRRVSAVALAQIGTGTQDDGGPDRFAIRGLVERLPIEPAVQVRREIVKALMVMGVPSDKQTWVDMRRNLEAAKKDADKTTGIWARITLMRSEEKKITEKDPNVRELVAMFKATDPALRVEALSALGQMGSEVAFLIPELQAVIANDKDVPTVGTAIWALSTMSSHAQEIIEYLKTVEKTHTVEGIRKTAGEAIKWMVEVKKEAEKKDPNKEVVPKKK
jgi:HEAT repeat protein